MCRQEAEGSHRDLVTRVVRLVAWLRIICTLTVSACRVSVIDSVDRAMMAGAIARRILKLLAEMTVCDTSQLCDFVAAKIPDADVTITTASCKNLIIGSGLKFDLLQRCCLARETSNCPLRLHVNDETSLVPGRSCK